MVTFFTLDLWDTDDLQCMTLVPQAILVLVGVLELTSSCCKVPGMLRLNCAKTVQNDLSFATLECLVVLEGKTRVCDSVTAETDVLLLPQFGFEFEDLVRNLAILESYKKSKRSPRK